MRTAHLYRISIVFWLAICSTPDLRAQTSNIFGVVADSVTRQRIPFANVTILNTTRGAASNNVGLYYIPKLPPGTYQVEARVIGYTGAVKEVSLGEGQSLEVDFELAPASVEIHEVLVNAPRKRLELEMSTSVQVKQQQELKAVPVAAQQDLLQSLKILPGIVSTSDVSSRFYVRGGASHLFFTKVTKGELWDFGTQTYLIVSVGFPQGTEIERYNQIATEVEKLALEEKAGIEKVTARVQSDYAVVRIDIADSASNTALPFELKDRLILYAAQTGGATIGVSGFGPGFYSGGGSAPSFYVKVLGYNYNKVKDIAEEFRRRIERNPRIAEVDIDRSFGRWNKTYELVVTVDRQAIARHGLTVVDVVRAVRSYTRGSIEQSLLDIGGVRVPYTVKFAGYRDFSVGDLRQTIIVNQKRERARLGELVGVEERRVPSEIIRENQQYLRLISFEYKGPYRFGDRFVDATIKGMPLPSGYMFDRSFAFFWLSESSQISLLWIAVFALVIVFMITSSLYESFVKPFVIILSVPFSLIGLFLSFYIADAPFGRGGYAAIVLLIGIVVTNSIVLVHYIAKRLKDTVGGSEIIVDAASTRLRPVLMTTLTTIGGVLPLLLMGERTSLWYSLSLGTIGGLLSSTLLTLVVVPVVYAMIHRVRISLRN